MLKKIMMALLAFLSMPVIFSVNAAAEVSVSAQSAALINADDGQLLLGKNENERHSMASTTKIMTALLALEAAEQENRVVTITDQMVQVEGSSMGLLPGYQLTLRDLAIGMLTVSGNDAANSAAISIAGSTEAFAGLMNQRAQELGMSNTHFITPSGLDSEEHYSTAADMAALGAAAIKNPDFLSICSQKQVSVQYSYPAHTVRYGNHNRLLSLYPDCIGVKTGFTKKSGRCLVSAAERDGVKLVAVTLNAPDDWNDHIALLDYGFSQLTSFTPESTGEIFSLAVTGGVEESVLLIPGESGSTVVKTEELSKIQKVIELPRFTYAPVRAGQTMGAIRYCLNGEVLTEVPLLAQKDIFCPEPPKNIFQRIIEGLKTLFR